MLRIGQVLTKLIRESANWPACFFALHILYFQARKTVALICHITGGPDLLRNFLLSLKLLKILYSSLILPIYSCIIHNGVKFLFECSLFVKCPKTLFGWVSNARLYCPLDLGA